MYIYEDGSNRGHSGDIMGYRLLWDVVEVP